MGKRHEGGSGCMCTAFRFARESGTPHNGQGSEGGLESDAFFRVGMRGGVNWGYKILEIAYVVLPKSND